MVTFGSGNHTYQVADGFFKRPKKWPFMEVADVAVDSKDNVYVFNRGPHPMMVFDREGNVAFYTIGPPSGSADRHRAYEARLQALLEAPIPEDDTAATAS